MPIRPGADPIRVLTRTINFDLVHSSQTVPLVNVDGGTVEDIFLSLWGEAGQYLTLPGIPFQWPHHLRVALRVGRTGQEATIDVTEAVLAKSRSHLDALDQATLATTYRKAALEWVTYARSTLAGPTLASLQTDVQAVERLASSKPFSDNLRHLGDRAFGTGGSLHPFGFLYRVIPLPALSARALLKTVGHSSSELLVRDVIVEQPIPEEAPAAQPGRYGAGGAISLVLELVVHNPLRDQLDKLERTITATLTAIEERLRADGDLMVALGTVQDYLLSLTSSLGEFEKRFKGTLAELEEMKATVSSLHQKVDALR
jgi:hypothetical protein